MTTRTLNFNALGKSKYYVSAWLRTGVVARFVWGVPEVPQTANLSILDAISVIEGSVAERIRRAKDYSKRAKSNLLKDLKLACSYAREGLEVC